MMRAVSIKGAYMTGKIALSLVLTGILVSCGGAKSTSSKNGGNAEPQEAASPSSPTNAASNTASEPAAASPEMSAAEPTASPESNGAESDPAAVPAAEDPGAPAPSDDLQSYVGGGGAYTPEYRTVTENMNTIKQCYLDALRGSPDIQGVLKIKFTVNKAGKVTKASALQNDLNDQVEKCVIASLKKLKFPKRTDNRTVEYPFKFMPAP
jgi:hypothetical protein